MWYCGFTGFPQVLFKLKSLKTLDIRRNENIRNLPNTLETLTNLETLNMESCGLTEFPQVLCKLKSLKTLNIGCNENIRNLPNTLENLTNLETLNMEHCGLTEFPQVLCKLKSLKTLDIRRSENIRNLPNTLDNLTNLETLNMWHCDLTEFPQVLFKLKSLKTLNIGRSENIRNLPNTLETLTNLETLNMQSCGLTGFPEVLCKLKSLKTLNIRWNENIRNLPNTLENLTNLETLNMESCGLTEFPQVLCKLKSLKTLDIRFNEKIRNLPNTLETLTNLETLNMQSCGLTEFPGVLCKLKSLKTLNIGWNKNIQNLPNTLENLTNLETLNMESCGLTEFPQVLCKLKSLQNLNISRNPLKELPTFIFEIKWLHKLDVSHTSIACLPRVIERCEHLEELDVSHTKIKEFPTVIFKMKNLQIVIATNVSIQVLDEDFVKLWSQRPEIFTKGRFLKVVGDNLEHFVKPPREIVRRGPEACLKYYKALKAKDAVNCSIINVTLMGKTGAGKSSLIQSIKEGYSVLVDPADRTVVVDTLEVKHRDVILKITDFGGHDIYEITCPLFLKSTKQVAIIAVKVQEYNENKHDELVTKWLTTAVSHMKNGSVCIVATQCDLCTEHEVQEKMRILKEKVDNWIEEETSFKKKLRPHQPKIIGVRENIFDKKNIHYFQSSSLTMKGVHDVEDFLFREAKLSRLVLPERWTEVYKQMDTQTALGAHFVTETEYQTLFNTTYPSPVIPDNEESLQCLQFLHDSGMVLWYGEKHDNLRKIIFHDPSFLVSILQCLFRHDLADVLEYDHDRFGQYFNLKSTFQREAAIFIKTGILSPQLLRCVWQEFKFSPEVFETMVEILTMLDLCYSDGQRPYSMLRLPWFVQDENMEIFENFMGKEITFKYSPVYSHVLLLSSDSRCNLRTVLCQITETSSSWSAY